VTWRLTVHQRQFGTTAYARHTGIGEITDARSRRLELTLNQPAKLTFTVDGRSPSATAVQELTTEMMAWSDGKLVFRGPVTASEDVVSEQSHALNITAVDYLGILIRRYLTAKTDLVYTQQDQDIIVADLLARAKTVASAGGTSFAPGSQLPLAALTVNPDGTFRSTYSGQLRDRTYQGGASIGDAITSLAGVINGFDVDVRPAADTDGTDYLQVWFGARGIARPDLPLAYGTTVNSFTRSVQSTAYSNYVRVIGDNGGTEGAPQLVADQWNADANDVGRIPVGLWMESDNESDVKIQSTLQAKADGNLATSGVLVPTYSLVLAPGAAVPNLGDTVPLILRTGRLDVSATVRVMAISYAPNDDTDDTDVEITVGRPAKDLSALFRDIRRDVDALARR